MEEIKISINSASKIAIDSPECTELYLNDRLMLSGELLFDQQVLTKKSFLDSPIKDNTLSARPEHILKKLKLFTPRMVLMFGYNNLRITRGMGVNSLNEITTWLSENGCEFGMDLRKYTI